jgi:hypothetical protein
MLLTVIAILKNGTQALVKNPVPVHVGFAGSPK